MKSRLWLAIPAALAFGVLLGFSECPKSSPVVYGVGDDPGDENLTFRLLGGGTESTDPGESVGFEVTAETVYEIDSREYNPSVTLSTQNLPEGVEASFSVNPVNANANQSSILTVTPNVEMAPGQYQFQIVGNNGTDTDSVDCLLIVNGPGIELFLSAEDGQIYDQNYGEVDDRDAYYYLDVTMPDTFNGTVTLGYMFSPDPFGSAVTGTWTPMVLDFSDPVAPVTREVGTKTMTAELHFERISNVSIGNYFFTVTATPSGSGYSAGNTGTTLSVTAPSAQPGGG